MRYADFIKDRKNSIYFIKGMTNANSLLYTKESCVVLINLANRFAYVFETNTGRHWAWSILKPTNLVELKSFIEERPGYYIVSQDVAKSLIAKEKLNSFIRVIRKVKKID
jgi:hypothetical protein